MSRLTGLWPADRWRRNSKPAKLELYTRWSFHTFGISEICLVFGTTPWIAQGQAGGWLVALAFVHATLCTLLLSRGLDWRLGRREQPVRLVLVVVAVSAAGIAAVFALHGTGAPGEGANSWILATVFPGFGLSAASFGLPERRMGLATLGTGAAVAACLVATGPFGDGSAIIGAVSGGSGALVLVYGCSAWQLIAVWEIDAARALQSRLAVAEERLRFGRDLHDVMGRNLAVIALKSELAVQLAERDRPEAAAQMAEVQRIAQETQREVRDVVRGYREADLRTELEGARAVLTAAEIDCRIEGTGDAGGTGDAALSAEVQSALAWVVREATTNVLRHGDARRCTVRLETDGPQAVLVVENDGVTEDGAARDGRAGADGRGSGLAGLRERLAALDGVLAAERVADGCFRLTARVPSGAGVGAGAGAGTETDPAVGKGVAV